MAAYNLAIQLRKSGLGRRRIEEELALHGFSHLRRNVQSWIYHNRKPLEIKEIKENAFRLTEDKSYILGVIGPGDGFIREGMGIYLSVIDKDFAESFKRKAENVYGIKASKTIQKISGFGKKPRVKISIYSTRLLNDLERYEVGFKEYNWRIPEQIKKASDKIKCAYISGFADSQGSASKREITIASKNEKGLNEMLKLIQSLGIRVTKRMSKKDFFVVSIHGRGSLMYFYEKIRFNIRRKQEKLRNSLANFKNYKHTTPRSGVEFMVPKMKKLKNKGLTQKEIANYLDISDSVVCRRLKKFNGR